MLKHAKACVASLREDSLPTDTCKRCLHHSHTTHVPSHQDHGNTTHLILSSAWLSTTLWHNARAARTLIISSTCSKHTAKSAKTGQTKDTVVSQLNQTAKTVRVTSPCQDASNKHCNDSSIPHPHDHSMHHIDGSNPNAMLKSNISNRITRHPSWTPKMVHASKRSLAHCSTVPGQWTPQCWQKSDPLQRNNLRQPRKCFVTSPNCSITAQHTPT